MSNRKVVAIEPYNYYKLSKDIHELQFIHSMLEVAYIGASVMGKPIPALKLGNGPRKLHINAAVHANEWLTSLLLMTFIEQIMKGCLNTSVTSRIDIRAILDKTTIWIVPMANPDGVDLVQQGWSADHPFAKQLLIWNNGMTDFTHWKANIRGVDLNDQFPANWETERSRRSAAVNRPGPRDYTGLAPLTEPEAAALVQLTNRCRFDMVLSLHSQGEEIYWNYRDLEPPESEAWAGRFASASGYKAVKLYDSDAGYKDWFIAQYGRPGFTIEVGLGENPLPLSAFDDIYESVSAILLEAILG